jgi:hypothetical protein
VVAATVAARAAVEQVVVTVEVAAAAAMEGRWVRSMRRRH